MPPEPINHPYLSRLKGGSDLMLADNAGLSLRYTTPQVRLFCNFDGTLRAKKFDRTVMTYAGGYDDFASLWNQAEDVPFKFCTLDGADNTLIHGEHPDADYLAPLPPTTTTIAGPQYTEDQQESIEAMKWQTIRSQRLRTQRIEQSKAQAKAKRQREEEEKKGRIIGGAWVDEGNVGGNHNLPDWDRDGYNLRVRKSRPSRSDLDERLKI
ncbi:hypothetical protein LXA43DRAFT_1069844 [Ganoderma leucocontextum]|nr:hypothetical protein LXA43DRAFT_1069844 [Ganoderma leucocontextum]